MELMANSAGNAEDEMAIAMDSIEYKLNIFKETGTGIAQNIFSRESLKTLLDSLNKIGEALDWITDKTNLLGTLGLGAGAFLGIKNVGILKCGGSKYYCFAVPTV